MLRIAAYRADLVALGITALNGLAGNVHAAVAQAGLAGAIPELLGVSAVVWLALGLALHRLHCDREAETLPALPLLLLALACTVPSAQVSWLAGAAYFAWRIATRARGHHPMLAGHLIALALCARTPLIWLLTTLFAEPLLQADAVLSGLLAGLLTQVSAIEGNIVVNATGHRLFVMTGCSSLNNLSLALLFWFSATRGLLSQDRHPPLHHAALLSVAVIGVNMTRLALMAQSPETYAWLHDGSGADLVALVTMLAVAGVTCISLNGGRHETRSA